jgi:hypothetical protein
VVFTFKYHSATQRLVHGAPFVLLLCLTFVAFRSGNDELAKYLGVIAFGWFLLANFLINLMISRFGTRVGPIDFSPNLSPSRTDRIARWLIFLISGAVSLVVAIIVVQGLKRGLAVQGIKRFGLEDTLLFGGGTLFLVLAGTVTFLYLAVFVLSGFRIRPPDRPPKPQRMSPRGSIFGKPKHPTEAEMLSFAELIARPLNVQLDLAAEMFGQGRRLDPNPRALGYIYGRWATISGLAEQEAIRSSGLGPMSRGRAELRSRGSGPCGSHRTRQAIARS